MGKEIVINAQTDQTRIAIVEGKELVELYIENPGNERTLGDIYLGRVRRIMPSIQAAFVDIGQKSDAFLHFSDIANNIQEISDLLALKKPNVGDVKLPDDTSKASRRKRPLKTTSKDAIVEEDEAVDDDDDRSSRPSYEPYRPEKYLKADQPLLVKIVKEPISAKGSRISTDISLAGRFLVLVPLANYVAVSKKIISFKERRRLRTLAKSLLPDGFGLIVRTVAENKNAKVLDTDLRLLIDKWRKIERKLAENSKPPTLLHEDVNMVSSVIRDLFSDDFDRVVIDDPRVYRNIKGYVQAVAPQLAQSIRLHRGKESVFKASRIDKAVTQAFQSRVNLPTGGYIYIEHTEAMHVIDVNSGRSGRGLSQEQNSLRVNLEAARIVAQQLRLRDLGGIIVVDFIDLRDDRNRRKVYEELKKCFRRDRAVTKILPMSDFGLLQITRQRLRPSITTQISHEDPETQPAAKSTSGPQNGGEKKRKHEKRKKISPAEMVEKLERWISRYRNEGSKAPLLLKVHPFTAAYLRKSKPSQLTKWYFKYFVRIKLEEDEALDPGQYRFFDSKTGKNLSRGRSRHSFKNKNNSKEKKSSGSDKRRNGGRGKQVRQKVSESA